MSNVQTDEDVRPTHDHERAEANWKRTALTIKAINFFAKRNDDKLEQRDTLNSFMMRMKRQRTADTEELNRKLIEYSSIPSNMNTCRPKSPEHAVPYPEVPTYVTYEVPPGTKCALCQEMFAVFREHEAHPCRVCDDVFHKECLENCGDLTKTDKHNIYQARTNFGWSCPKCANISLLLSPEEIKKMADDFDRIDFNHDAQITLPEYLMHNARRVSLINGLGNLLSQEETRLSQEFRIMDQDGDGTVDWWEFVNREAKLYIAKQDKNYLVSQLSNKELSAAKATFRSLDKDGEGRVKQYGARSAFKTWFKQFENRRTSVIAGTKRVTGLDHHATVFTDGIIMDNDESDVNGNLNRNLKWEDFILNQALYIISARPNTRVPGQIKRK